MIKHVAARCVVPPSEEGYALLWVIFLLAVFIIALSVAVPKVAKDIQRDREIETMHRGKQYIRAIQLYYRKFGRYPPNVDALVNTNEIRFLRKKYADPTTGKDEWNLVLFGQAKTPMAIGFFGQPLSGSWIGPSGGYGVNGASAPGSSFMSSSNSAAGTNGTSSTANASGDASATAGGTDSTSTSAFGPSASGQTFGGAGIIGFSPQSPKQSILVYKGMNHYNEWEFVYSPIQERNSATGIVGGSGGSASGNGISGAGNNNTSGGTASGNGISGTGDDGNWAGGLLGGTGR